MLGPESVEQSPLEIGYDRVLVDQHQAHTGLPSSQIRRPA
jgi:hypothetical protein